MGIIMVVLGLILLGFAVVQIRGGVVQKELATFIPELAAGNGSADSIASFQERREVVFLRHGVTDAKKKQALTNYARIIAKGKVTPAQNEMLLDLLKRGLI